jgi:peptidoglycan/xylan/chitin deacetylase (PgdA/CDA1 family)
MVLVGLVLGVLVAIVVASNGCGENHPGKRTFHGGGGSGSAGAASASAPGAASVAGGAASASAGAASIPGGAASMSGGAASASRAALARRADPQGPFFHFVDGRLHRWDAPRRRMVALTFDDGPGPDTPRILDALERLHARATFFVVGAMAATRPDVVRAEKRAGMQIGNHTWSHPVMPKLSVAEQRSQIQSTNRILRSLTGVRPRFFRPPDWRVGERTARIATQERMIGVLRTVDTRDWTLPGVRAIIRSALRVRPGGIVAMHDAGGYTRAQTVAAVPHIVRGLRRRHLELVTVSRLYG